MYWHYGSLELKIRIVWHLLAVLRLWSLLFFYCGRGNLLLRCLLIPGLGLAIRLLHYWRLLLINDLWVICLAARCLLDDRWRHLHIDSVVLVTVHVGDYGLVLSTLPLAVDDELILVDSRCQLVWTTQEQLELVIEHTFHCDGLPTGKGARYADVTTAPCPLKQVTARRLESFYDRLLLRRALSRGLLPIDSLW
jgi:hypothetical protein